MDYRDFELALCHLSLLAENNFLLQTAEKNGLLMNATVVRFKYCAGFSRGTALWLLYSPIYNRKAHVVYLFLGGEQAHGEI